MDRAVAPERTYEGDRAEATEQPNASTLRGQQELADRLTYQLSSELTELAEVLDHHLRPDDRQPGPKLVDEDAIAVDRVPLSPAARHARTHAADLNRLLDDVRILRARVDL
jgi:hypothetical protein